MVVTGVHDWELHKKQVLEKLSTYDLEAATEFIKMYSDRWNKFEKSLLYYGICWRLYDNYKIVERSGVKWYAIVGSQGMGKTTLSWKIAYFLDSKFTLDYCCFTTKLVVEKMLELKDDSMRCIVLDEPPFNATAQSRQGQLFANVIGQLRQQKLFMIYNSPDLAFIPNYIFRKITGLFWIANPGEVYFFEDRPKEYKYPLSEIKLEYYKKKYYAFIERMKSSGCIPFTTSAQQPFTEDEVSGYLSRKKASLEDAQKLFLQENRADKKVLAQKWYKDGMSSAEIAKRLRISERHALRLAKE